MVDIFIRIASFMIGYLLGSINPAYFLTKKVAGKDIREVGSKNAGTSNVFMTVGPKYGVLIFLGDGLKTALACTLAFFLFRFQGATGWLPVLSGISTDLSALSVFYAGMGTIIGHDFPFYLGFRGGKGTACWILWIFFLDYRIFLIAMVLAFLAGWLTRYMVVATVVLVCASCVALALLVLEAELLGIFVFFALLSMFMHRSNFIKLFRRSEPKIY